ncbi:MAG: T9SS type A sorting domain-containing protein [Bacteroidota bacterium]
MKIFLSIVSVCLLYSLKAQTTFSEYVAPIIYNKCSSCHHVGGIAPLAFTSYAEVKKQVGMIVMAAIDSKFMPPWMPDTAYSHFVDERKLTESESVTIKKWITDGMPQGDKAAEPELPLFPKGSQLGKPDLTVSMQQAFTHKGNNEDAYRVFVLPTGLKEGHDVSAIEIIPGNPKIAHHIILGLDTTRMAEKLDDKDENYGYEQYSGFGFYPTYDNWSGWVPGNKTRFFPQGISNYVLPNSKVLLQMHYGPSPIDTKDSTVVNIYYNKNSNGRYIRGGLISPNDIIDGPFFIPANKKKTFHAKYKVVSDYSLINITPHAHWLGKKWEVFAVHPNGDTTHLIKINDWDFNWQNFFSFKKFIKLEKGTMIYTSAEFDNTERNFRQPNNPIKNVLWGESAKDEMFLCYFAFVPYQKGDEDIDIAGNINLMTVINNTTEKKLAVDYSLSDNTPVTIKLYSADGKVAKEVLTNQQTISGKHQTEIDTKTLKPGTYWLKFTSAYYTESRKVII